MKKLVKSKPLVEKEFQQLIGKFELTDLSLNTGARIAEIKRIIDQWDGKDYVDIKTKKSGENTNRIYLNARAIECLKSLQPKYKGKTVRTITRAYESISVEVGIPFTSHNLRSTFATRMLAQGNNLVIVKTLMNHSDVSQTAAYVKFNEAELRPAIENIYAFETFEGKSMPELVTEITKLRNKIRFMEMQHENN